MQCKATSKRTGERCRAQAITGKNVCRHHGGITGARHGAPLGSQNAAKHNLYSRYLAGNPAALEAYEYHKTNPDFWSGKPELSVQRANLSRYIERVHADGREPTAEEMEHIDQAAERIQRAIDREERRRIQESAQSGQAEAAQGIQTINVIMPDTYKSKSK